MNAKLKKQLGRLFKYFTLDGMKASLERKRARKRKKNPPGLDAYAARTTIAKYMEESFKSATREHGRSPYYVPKSANPIQLDDLPVKLIAFYLPQYHPIPENNRWWGAGFTEWTNVAKARPQFVGHYQPHVPGELGFYDLRLIDTIRQQAELANHYGVHGFCFYFYWFNGKRLLERPIEIFLENKDISINFCFCWANENWTRRWDGAEHDVLMHQDYSAEDDIEFIKEASKAFSDPRYIRIGNLPVLLIYRAANFPNIRKTASRWRSFMLEAGYEGIYLISAESFERINPDMNGLDAAVEFPPHQTHLPRVTSGLNIINAAYSGEVYDYSELPESFGKKEASDYELFKTVMPSWDNEPRKPGKGFSFINATPPNYAKWLDNAIKITLKKPPEKRLLFINAWNEWGEGTHLEPDLWNGYAYLQATADQLKKNRIRSNRVTKTNKDPQTSEFTNEHESSS